MSQTVLKILIICFVIFAFSGLVYFLFFSPSQTTITQQTEQAPTQQETQQTQPGKNQIFIYSDRYEPTSLTVKVGETVEWINKDTKQHILVLLNPPLQKTILPGQSFSFETYKTGIIEFYDGENENMRGSVTVS